MSDETMQGLISSMESHLILNKFEGYDLKNKDVIARAMPLFLDKFGEDSFLEKMLTSISIRTNMDILFGEFLILAIATDMGVATTISADNELLLKLSDK